MKAMKKIIRFSLGFIMAAITIVIAHSIYDCFYVSWQEEKESVQYVGVVSLYSFDKQGRTIGQLINIERL